MNNRNFVPQFIIEQYQSHCFGGKFEAASLFVDISGFTFLTEVLMRIGNEGAEVLTDVLNSVFGPIVHEVYAHGGMITTFAGDAFTALFPYDNEEHDAHLHALQTAFFIDGFFLENPVFSTRFGSFGIQVKVGLGIGDVEWGILGKDDLHTYFFRGEAVDACAHSEHFAEKGDVIAESRFFEKVHDVVLATPIADHYKLTAFSGDVAAVPTVARYFSQDELTPFVSCGVQTITQSAEFRAVVSLFIAFEEPETASELNAFVTEVMTLSQAYGGHFNKIDFGDKGSIILLLFGAPLAHENDPERAIDFLLALQKPAPGVRWRAGVTLGDVYAGIIGGEERSEYTAIGDTVNLSARLMMAADWNEIWVSEEAADRLKLAYHFENLGVRQFKGKTGDIIVCQLVAKGSLVRSALFEGKMVGRDQELEKLRQWVLPILSRDQAAMAANPGVMYVYGEAGIGKSRLLHEFRQALADEHDFVWFYMPAEEILRQPLHPFKYFLRDYFQQSSDASSEENRRSFDQALNSLIWRLPETSRAEMLARELERTRSFLGVLVDLHQEGSLYEQLDPQLRFENTLSAFTALIRAESLVRPVIIELDDGHWLDVESQSMLRSLTLKNENYPYAILISSRYLDDGSKPFFSMGDGVRTEEIDLNYLPREGIRALAEQILSGQAGEDVIDFLEDKTNGNPFFVEQLVLDLTERNLFERREQPGGMVISLAEFSAEDVPTSINAVLVSRLDRLTAEVKRVVQTASVLGREFEINILSRMLIGDGHVPTLVNTAADKNVWSPLDEMHYIFRHALLRDSSYRMQLRAVLRDLHRLAGEAIEVIYAEDLDSYYTDLAYHYEQGGVAAKTREYLRKAADQAKANYQNETALLLYERLLRYLPIDDSEQVHVLERRGDIYENIGEYDLALIEYEIALDLAVALSQMGDASHRLADLNRKVGLVYVSKGQYDQALDWLERARSALTVAEEVSQAMAHVCLAFAGALYRKGDASEALAWCQRGLGIAEAVDDTQILAHAYQLRGTIHTGLGDLQAAIEDDRVSLELSRKRADLLQQTKVENSLGADYYYFGDWNQAIEHYRHSLDVAEQIGWVEQIATVSNNLGELYLIRGDFVEATKRFETCLTTWRRTGFQLGVALSHRNLAQIYIKNKDWDAASEQLGFGLRVLETMSTRDWLTAEVYRHLAEVGMGQGRWDDAWVYCREASDIMTSQDIKLVASDVLRLQGILYSQQRKWAEAEAALERSLAVAEELGLRYEQGQALAELARLYQVMDENDLSVRQARMQMMRTRAETIFTELGARWDLAQLAL